MVTMVTGQHNITTYHILFSVLLWIFLVQLFLLFSFVSQCYRINLLNTSVKSLSCYFSDVVWIVKPFLEMVDKNIMLVVLNYYSMYFQTENKRIKNISYFFLIQYSPNHINNSMFIKDLSGSVNIVTSLHYTKKPCLLLFDIILCRDKRKNWKIIDT